ncbi:hypothetical protein JB92DRAFT_478078 [Gautieria morchelliformis]|nr:hypothetical protein JB92DRAFT_478078 [Gautieria morchelliformis]
MNADVEAIVAGYAPTKYGSLAAFSMLVYDYALTFDAEVEFVWQRRWSFGKALFIFNRYFGLLSLLSYVIGTVFMRGSADVVEWLIMNSFCAYQHFFTAALFRYR